MYNWKFYKDGNKKKLVNTLKGFKQKLNCKEDNYIYGILSSYISNRYGVNISPKELSLITDISSMKCESNIQKEYNILIILTKILISIEHENEFQTIGTYNIVDSLTKFERTKCTNIWFEVDKCLGECDSGLKVLFEKKIKSNFIHKFFTQVMKDGKYHSFWRGIKDGLYYYDAVLKDDLGIDIDKLREIRVSINKYRDAQNGENIKKEIYGQCTNILREIEGKKNELNQQLPTINLESVPKTTRNEVYDINNIFGGMNIIGDQKINTAMVSALSIFRSKKNLFEVCKRDMYILEELVYFIYNATSEMKKKPGFKRTLEKFMEENISNKDCEYICSAIVYFKQDKEKELKRLDKGNKMIKKRNGGLDQESYETFTRRRTRGNTQMDRVTNLVTSLVIGNLLGGN